MNIFSTEPIIDRDMFSFLGMTSTSLFGNYNLAFFVMCLVPFVIGFGALLVLRIQT